MASRPPLRNGVPASLWFFVVTVGVYLLQWFPLTGIFLMILAVPFWSAVLINLGMAGVVVEVLSGKARPVWLLLPALYLSGYYTLYAWERRKAAALVAEIGAFNAAQRLPFAVGSQDLLVIDNADVGLQASSFLSSYALDRVFDGNGRVTILADAEVHALVTGNKVFESADIRVSPLRRWRDKGVDDGTVLITMAGRPDRPVVEVRSSFRNEKHDFLPVTLVETEVLDTSSRRTAVVRSGVVGLLKPFPLWTMGCALNSGAAKWQCFHGFMRDRVGLAPSMRPFEGPTKIVAAALGLPTDEKPAARAVGAAFLRPLVERVERQIAAKELHIVEQILADPSLSVKDSWLWHLPNRPDATESFVPAMVDALGRLTDDQRRGSENARQLWRLLASQPEAVLAPHRPRLVGWLGGPRRGLSYDSVRDFLPRLDPAVSAERAVLLDRLELERGDLPSDLLPGFCRMGTAVPDEAKQRLLALWRRRGEPRGSGHPDHRDQGDAMLYFTLARLGLKAAAGQVEQRYLGPTFIAIGERAGPGLPTTACPANGHQLDLWAKGKWPT